MDSLFYLFLAVIVGQRLVELGIARSNASYIRSLGGYEVGREHYKYIVALHSLFFVTMIVEVIGFDRSPPDWWPVPVIGFALAQVLRYWSISSLGRFWNTRILVLPRAQMVSHGPYKYFRHPNYLVVMVELLTIPLIFGAFVTAIVFSVANLLLLSVRIRIEERALREVSEY